MSHGIVNTSILVVSRFIASFARPAQSPWGVALAPAVSGHSAINC